MRKQRILKVLEFPIFAVSDEWMHLIDDEIQLQVNCEGEYILISGGGGGKNYGIKSMLHVYNSNELKDPIYSEDTGTDIVTSIELSPTITVITPLIYRKIGLSQVEAKWPIFI